MLKKIIGCLVVGFLAADAVAAQECVVMVHGMWRTKAAMAPLAQALRAQGYYVVNESYPTHRFGVKYVADIIIPTFVAQCQAVDATKIHFITHSIGGLIVRSYLGNHSVPSGSRVVMLAPPNHGSRLADELHTSLTYRTLMGPMGLELQTGDSGLAESLPTQLPVELGIITGNTCINPFSATLLGSGSDGKVTVESAKLAGMKDFLVVPSSHTFIMTSKTVIKACVEFLTNGHFPKSPT